MTDWKPLILKELGLMLQDRKANKEVWKARAYQKAIKGVEQFHGPIHDMADIDGIEGIGKTGSIREHIQEIFRKGFVEEIHAKYDPAKLQAQQELEKVAGIGPSKAKELVFEHNVMSISELKKRPDLLHDKQLIGLKHVEDFEKRIPRKEIDGHVAFLDPIIRSIHPNMLFQITGSYRRRQPNSGDIDLLVSCDDTSVSGAEILDALVSRLQQEGYLYETLAKGDKKYMGVCKLRRHKTFRRFDIMFTSREMYPFALLYFTGSGDFNVHMRRIALQKGYSLSEYGIKPSHSPKADFIRDTLFREEEHIFCFLDIPYIAPEERTPDALSRLGY